MEIDLLKLKLYNNKYSYEYFIIKIKIINFRDFMKKFKLKDETMNEAQLQRVHNYSICPRDFKKHSDKGFVNLDNRSQGGTHWTCFIVKDNKSYNFDSLGGQPDNFLLNQLPITYNLS